MSTPKLLSNPAACGQSRQRRTFAQHDPSGLGAVAGATSTTSAPAQRGSERRVGVEVALGEDAEVANAVTLGGRTTKTVVRSCDGGRSGCVRVGRGAMRPLARVALAWSRV